jgi:hypothetical protein
MIEFLSFFPGFTKGPSAPTPSPAPVDREDPAAAAAKEKLRLAEKRRKGRRASILTDNQGAGEEGVIKRSAALGGGSGTL